MHWKAGEAGGCLQGSEKNGGRRNVHPGEPLALSMPVPMRQALATTAGDAQVEECGREGTMEKAEKKKGKKQRAR